MSTSALTLLLWIVVVLIFGVAGVAIAYLLRLRRFLLFLSIVLSTCSGIAAVYTYKMLASPSQCKVDITAPVSGTVIRGNTVDVAGTVSPAEARVTVIVSSERDDRWWVQAIVVPEVSGAVSGGWTIKAYLGTADTGFDQNYYLIALGSTDGDMFNILTDRFIRSNKAYRASPQWAQSKPVVVRKIK